MPLVWLQPVAQGFAADDGGREGPPPPPTVITSLDTTKPIAEVIRLISREVLSHARNSALHVDAVYYRGHEICGNDASDETTPFDTRFPVGHGELFWVKLGGSAANGLRQAASVPTNSAAAQSAASSSNVLQSSTAEENPQRPTLRPGRTLQNFLHAFFVRHGLEWFIPFAIRDGIVSLGELCAYPARTLMERLQSATPPQDFKKQIATARSKSRRDGVGCDVPVTERRVPFPLEVFSLRLLQAAHRCMVDHGLIIDWNRRIRSFLEAVRIPAIGGADVALTAAAHDGKEILTVEQWRAMCPAASTGSVDNYIASKWWELRERYEEHLFQVISEMERAGLELQPSFTATTLPEGPSLRSGGVGVSEAVPLGDETLVRRQLKGSNHGGNNALFASGTTSPTPATLGVPQPLPIPLAALLRGGGDDYTPRGAMLSTDKPDESRSSVLVTCPECHHLFCYHSTTVAWRIAELQAALQQKEEDAMAVEKLHAQSTQQLRDAIDALAQQLRECESARAHWQSLAEKQAERLRVVEGRPALPGFPTTSLEKDTRVVRPAGSGRTSLGFIESEPLVQSNLVAHSTSTAASAAYVGGGPNAAVNADERRRIRRVLVNYLYAHNPDAVPMADVIMGAWRDREYELERVLRLPPSKATRLVSQAAIQ